MLGEFRRDAFGDVVVDARAGETTNIEKIAALRQALCDLADLLGAIVPARSTVTL